MKPGPELDRIIAEKVMGWTVCVEPLICQGCNTDTMLDGNGKVWHRGDVWSPSTNIAHAFEVVEKVRLLDFPCSLQRNIKGEWFVEEYCGEVCSILSRADSAPHAICLAALKAVGGDK